MGLAMLGGNYHLGHRPAQGLLTRKAEHYPGRRIELDDQARHTTRAGVASSSMRSNGRPPPPDSPSSPTPGMVSGLRCGGSVIDQALATKKARDGEPRAFCM